VDKQQSLALTLEWLHQAITVGDATQFQEAGKVALTHLLERVKESGPLVLSCTRGELFIHGYDVQAGSPSAEGISRSLGAVGIVSVLVQQHVGLEDLLLFLAVLRGEAWGPGALDDPEGPLGEGRGIRVFTA